MLENIYRHMEEDGLGPFEAALKGSREIGFTIMSITVSLVAVFIPVLLMGGIIGRIFNEFAVVVTVAIAASAFVSLTLTPMLAAKILRTPEKDEALRAGACCSSAASTPCCAATIARLQYSLRHQPMMLRCSSPRCWRPPGSYATPKGFFPQEDIGQLSVSTEARQDISFEAWSGLQQQVAEALRRSPYVANVASIVGSTGGSSGLNTGRLFVELKPRDQRPALQKVLARPAARDRPHSRHQHVRDAGAEPAHRRALEPGRVSVRRAEPRPAAAVRVVAEDGRRHEPRPRISPTSTAICRSTPRRRR